MSLTVTGPTTYPAKQISRPRVTHSSGQRLDMLIIQGKTLSIGVATVEKRLLLYDYQNVKFATRYSDTLFLLFVILCAIIFQSPDKWYNKIERGGKGSGLIMNLVRVILPSYLIFLAIFSYEGQGIRHVITHSRAGIMEKFILSTSKTY